MHATADHRGPPFTWGCVNGDIRNQQTAVANVYRFSIEARSNRLAWNTFQPVSVIPARRPVARTSTVKFFRHFFGKFPEPDAYALEQALGAVGRLFHEQAK